MFNKTGNSTLIQIPDNCFGYNFDCYVPPIGYGVNAATGLLQKTDIIERKADEIDQYWVRPSLPYDFILRRREEKKVQAIDRYYVDEYLEDIRVREWNRRMCGVWFYNYNPYKKEVEATYITNVHYLYITHWKFQGKYNDFRVPDKNLYYVRSYCDTDPNSLGLNEITKRKNGKTARSGCWLYERTSRMNNHHGGIQSKTDDDGWGVFKKAIVYPWRTLPDFFRPRYDTMKGDNPNDELRFFATSRRGSKTEEEDWELEEPLESWIDSRPAVETGYDGDELHSYVSDETGKTTKTVDVLERQNIVRYASEIDGEFKGKHWFTTTVEPDKNEPENYNFQELTIQSNPLNRDENGRTLTGLYSYFLPAYQGMYFDKYGFPDEIRAKTYLDNTINKYLSEGNTRKAASFRRKNPQTFKEAFASDGENSLYNPELLNKQLDIISWTNKFTEFGDLIWENGDRIFYEKTHPDKSTEIVPSKIVWQPNPNGRFEKITGWRPKEPNKVYYHAGKFHPNNNYAIRIGCDPFRYDKTKDKRRSNCAAFAYQIGDSLYPDLNYDDAFVLRYAQRPDSTREANEDILKMAWWCGCQVLFERNVNHWKNDFIDWYCSPFLMFMPMELEPGIITASGSSGVQNICNYTEAYINEHISKVYFKTLIRKETGWLGFKVEDTEKFDEPMAAGITLINVRGAKRNINHSKLRDIREYFGNSKVWAV